MREQGLVDWQWRLYPDGHANRVNLLVHIVTVPIFIAGTCHVVLGLVTGHWAKAVGGAVAMVLAIAAQGRTHKREATAPVPFDGPFDIVGRLFVEQWVNFPRFVLSGGFGRAWRRSASS